MPPEKNADVITADAQAAALQAILAAHGRPATEVLAGADAAPERLTSASPQTTEGPYYVDTDGEVHQRADIAEGRPGVPLQLRITVLSADQGTPVPGATVEVWHCDALGYYSGHLAHDPDTLPTMNESGHVPPSDGSRFLRGGQPTDADGAAEFNTIYPGWYFTRSIHIHTKVRVGGREVYTGQLYLPEEYNEAIEAFPPYNQHTTLQRLPNKDDLVYRSAGGADLLLDVSPVDFDSLERGLTASFTLAVALP
ncbi:intradiol ring-cleavage dioxygenase [Streptomyces acidicola]|uniref:Intradiol ring-cleavage dioxygenase n=1 Tax=Streptomyces acidicola TaxID=2596892 RepID=A0A5N8X403_9ACTN|nr:intradiol ring-cleavage dioxygenase [Streptomyces acidicola]MPY53786.1 intradiol ring-cleavage dioxygenase [Streptomyces acidicola]